MMQFNTMPDKKNLMVWGLVALLVLGNIVFATLYFSKAEQAKTAQKALALQQTNGKVAAFLKLFVEKVLKTDKEVSFEDRLQLENAIRNIDDPEVLAKWEQFTTGTNEAQIQAGVKALLEILANKIYY